jgi:hypothetical protein
MDIDLLSNRGWVKRILYHTPSRPWTTIYIQVPVLLRQWIDVTIIMCHFCSKAC